MTSLDLDPIPATGGTYVLILRKDDDSSIEVGRLGAFLFPTGYYGYVGSAFGPGGLRARVGRHLRREAPLRWHIDYLRRAAFPVEVWFSTSARRLEHAWAGRLAALSGLTEAVPGFGASDCRCASHLFRSRGRPSSDRLRDRATGRPIRIWRSEI